MTQTEFESLLDWMSSVRVLAGERYEAARDLLIFFFEGRRFGDRAGELADVVFDTVAKKLAKGDAVPTDNYRAFLQGVARNIARDQWKKPVLESLSPSDDLGEAASGDRKDPRNTRTFWEQWSREQEAHSSKETRLRCLERCLQDLPAESRALILNYYQGEKHAKIENRQRLATDLQINMNALAIRVLRLRSKLETCVRKCMEG